MAWDFNRRKLLQIGALSGVSWFLPGLGSSAQAADSFANAELLKDPDRALQALMDGNQRFTTQDLRNSPHRDLTRVQNVATGQHPFATVLTCADSRVPVEILFDRGVGDIFDVRVAGNIVTPGILGSVEYAIDQLQTPVLMILGHENCGAVTAAVKRQKLGGDMSTFVDAIMPAVEQSKGQQGDAIDNAVRQNVSYQIQQITQSKLVQKRLDSGSLKIVGSRYDLDAGRVQIIA